MEAFYMCGIVGYVGHDQAAPFLLNGLSKLEYRGYDSAGLAVLNEGKINIVKSKGRLKVLSDLIDGGKLVNGTVGIGHTRWATHGAPSDINSHPQSSESGKFAVVHNGIIENYLYLKNYLINKGVKFVSETDTEVVAQMLDYYYKGDALEAIAKVLDKVEGSYALGIICSDFPDRVFSVRKDNPLIVGSGINENYIASDVPAILSKTRNIYRLKDDEIAVIFSDKVLFYDKELNPIQKDIEVVEWDVSAAEKGGYEHFMMKEIMEQPEAVKKTISPRIVNERIVFENFSVTNETFKKYDKIYVLGCGTSYHVAVVAKYAFEKLLRFPVEIDMASEFRYRSPIINDKTLVIVISQSGETADTLAALRKAKAEGAHTISVVNVVGSSIATESDDVIYTWAGPEISVCSTKAYSTQLAVIYMLAIYFADILGTISKQEYAELIDNLKQLPDKIQKSLTEKEKIQYFASLFFNNEDIYFIGRNVDYAVSLEASLKLKEISYIHSEAYTGGELKHGPISLIIDKTLVIAFCTYDQLYSKMVSNIEEVKARGATVLGVVTEKNAEDLKQAVDYAFVVPETVDFMLPSVSVIPFQLFAYYVASLRGCDIDKPRNLAKSVTVE
jgi:glucosamine--fructose-6-phosphate aminotransferase (isomerizing)